MSESIAERYSRLARESAGHGGVDLALRTLDIALGAFFILLALPLTIAIAGAVLLSSGPPLFYCGERRPPSGLGFVRHSWTRSRSSGTSSAAT